MKPSVNELHVTSDVIFEQGVKTTLRSECLLAGTIYFEEIIKKNNLGENINYAGSFLSLNMHVHGRE